MENSYEENFLGKKIKVVVVTNNQNFEVDLIKIYMPELTYTLGKELEARQIYKAVATQSALKVELMDLSIKVSSPNGYAPKDIYEVLKTWVSECIENAVYKTQVEFDTKNYSRFDLLIFEK